MCLPFIPLVLRMGGNSEPPPTLPYKPPIPRTKSSNNSRSTSSQNRQWLPLGATSTVNDGQQWNEVRDGNQQWSTLPVSGGNKASCRKLVLVRGAWFKHNCVGWCLCWCREKAFVLEGRLGLVVFVCVHWGIHSGLWELFRNKSFKLSFRCSKV